jgi:glycerol kinase
MEKSSDSEAMALAVEDSCGLYVVPAFVGLGAPYWDPYARGAVLGITRGANKNHLVRATLESLAYQTNDLIQAMTDDLGSCLVSLKVDGGACANNFLMQFQSDVLDCKVERPVCIETTSLGAAYLAGLATGYWKNKEDVLENWQVDRTFEPTMDAEKRKEVLEGWAKAVEKTRGWAK